MEVEKEFHLLFKVINEWYNQEKSLIFTTNVKENDWAELLGYPILTLAILDRIFHHFIIVTIKRPNYRMHERVFMLKKYEY